VPPQTKDQLIRVILRLIADTILVAILLFLSAGTLAWWRAWVLLAVLFLVRALGVVAVYRVNPGLLRERAGLPTHESQSWADRLLLLGVLATGFLGLPIVAAIDAFRWHALPRPAPLVSGLGLLSFALGWSVKSLALRANVFCIAVVRLRDATSPGGALPTAGAAGLHGLHGTSALPTRSGHLVGVTRRTEWVRSGKSPLNCLRPGRRLLADA
jgi:hypothetical protein